MVPYCKPAGMRRLIALTIFICVVTTACGPFQEDPSDPVLARVNNETLTLSTALEVIPEILLRQDTLAAIKDYQSSWVEERLLLMEASRIGLDSDPEIARRLERLRNRLILDALNKVLLVRHEDELRVSREEAGSYFQENRDQFILDERYIRFRHLTTRSRTEADQARRALLGGEPWPDIARRFSIDPERQIAQSERFFPISFAVPDNPVIQRYLGIIGRTEISEIVSHGGQFHFVQLLEEMPEGSNPELDWLVEQIEDWLYLEKSQRLITSFKRNLYLQAEANNEIEIADVTDPEHGIHHHIVTAHTDPE